METAQLRAAACPALALVLPEVAARVAFPGIPSKGRSGIFCLRSQLLISKPLLLSVMEPLWLKECLGHLIEPFLAPDGDAQAFSFLCGDAEEEEAKHSSESCSAPRYLLSQNQGLGKAGKSLQAVGHRCEQESKGCAAPAVLSPSRSERSCWDTTGRASLVAVPSHGSSILCVSHGEPLWLLLPFKGPRCLTCPQKHFTP